MNSLEWRNCYQSSINIGTLTILLHLPFQIWSVFFKILPMIGKFCPLLLHRMQNTSCESAMHLKRYDATQFVNITYCHRIHFSLRARRPDCDFRGDASSPMTQLLGYHNFLIRWHEPVNYTLRIKYTFIMITLSLFHSFCRNTEGIGIGSVGLSA